jgi:hypothetical protein
MTILPQIPPLILKPGQTVLTQSSIGLMQLCPKKFWFRHEMGLVPDAMTEAALSFGSLGHACLESLYGPEWAEIDWSISVRRDIQTTINEAYPNRNEDPHQKALWHYATAMMRGYQKRYPADSEGFSVLAVEQFAHGTIRNPNIRDKRGKSHKVVFALKADGLVERNNPNDPWNGTTWLLEHKTASSVDGAYLEKLQTDLQINIYSLYLQECFDIKITGVIYNVLVKSRLQQRMGETEEQFEARYAEQCAKNKSGKSSATRQLPETDDEFQARLAEFYSRPDSYHREEVLVDETRFDEVRAELWGLTQLYLTMRRTNIWPRNRKACWDYGRRCGYFDVCSAKDCDFEQMRELYLREEEPHSEIREFIVSPNRKNETQSQQCVPHETQYSEDESLFLAKHYKETHYHAITDRKI